MKKRLVILTITVILLSICTGTVFADTSDTGTATANISAGSLSITAQAVNFSATLTGSDQTVFDSDSTDWSAEDATGSGSGWHVTIASTDFTSGSDTITVDNFKVRLEDSSITTVSGNTKPASSITDYTALSTTAATLMSASAGNGMGVYNFVPDFSLDIAAETAAHSDYAATVTVNIISGP